MNLQALYHNPKSNYAFAYSSHELHIRLRTAKDDCKSAVLVIAKKHAWMTKQKFQMEKIATDRYFDYYQYNYATDDPRLGYYFLISDGEATLVYSESGVTEAFNDQYAYFHYFQYPFINPIDVHTVPSWVHEAIFYQIFVERFYNGDPGNDPGSVSPWGELPKPKSFFGGDLQGILEKLDYLKELGINGLYLTPIFESPSNHKYDTTDYRKVDPAFGDKDLLCKLIKQAHENGIRVILDGVFNHSGYFFAPFQDVLKNGGHSQYAGWFHFTEFPEHGGEPKYRCFGTSPNMPKLNTSNPQLKKYLFDTVAYWMEETGIDGWRLDVSDEIDHQFWRDFRQLVKGINPEAVIIGENWHNSYPWLMGDQFDGVMNYPVTKSCIQFFASGEISAEEFAEDLSGSLMWNSDQANFSMLNLLDSHDTMRFLTWCRGDKKKLMLAILFLFSYIGVPCTYYGTEIGMEGNGDPDSRRTFDWDENRWDKDLLAFYQQIISFRKSCKPLQYGNIKMWADDGVFYLERGYGDEKALTVLNNTGEGKNIVLPVGKAIDWVSAEKTELAESGFLHPFGGFSFYYSI
ncbi:glycoside hydrolase family 13 protein [Caproicibacter fermentans]|uniref:Alpha-glycosidase n=2 Tax=Caproicibacter fermentans TaxID=2576756 RepID=A0A7G8TAF1_9FIRM|nr:glycoside hydrolase family 13 protein [Caproicibacter fermentans]QNK40592.1 alpha-glycosidase [Caproicibacter fermentans]